MCSDRLSCLQGKPGLCFFPGCSCLLSSKRVLIFFSWSSGSFRRQGVVKTGVNRSSHPEPGERLSNLAIFWCFPCRDSFVRSVVKMFCRVLRSGFDVGPRIVLLAGSWAVSGEWRRSVRLWRWWPLTDHRVLWEGRPERSGLKAQRWWAGLLPRSPGPACHGPHARLASLPCRADWPLAASRAGGCLCQRVGQGRNMPRTRRDSPGNVLHRELPCSRCPRK